MSNTFVPRFTADGIYENPFWYAYNPYPDLPNCTCYAWGRFYEILGEAPLLQLGNAKQWFPKTVLYGPYETGAKPHVGAVLCLDSKDGDGHVAIVEQVNEDGTFIVSQSGFRRRRPCTLSACNRRTDFDAELNGSAFCGVPPRAAALARQNSRAKLSGCIAPNKHAAD